MRFEGLNRPLGLVSSVIAWGDEFVIHAVIAYCFFECFGGLVVQYVFFQAKAYRSHSADDLWYAAIISPSVLFFMGSLTM